MPTNEELIALGKKALAAKEKDKTPTLGDNKMTNKVELPEGSSKKDLFQFFKYLKTRKSLPKEKHNCHNCLFWHPEEEYHKYCGLGSITCINEVIDGKTPSRWLPRNPETP